MMRKFVPVGELEYARGSRSWAAPPRARRSDATTMPATMANRRIIAEHCSDPGRLESRCDGCIVRCGLHLNLRPLPQGLMARPEPL